MYVRLAFAVAAHLEPEILIVDEVLAVGDAQFQKKCLGKMEDVSQEGRTVIFVSHNMSAVSRLCYKAIFLVNGQLMSEGDTDQVISEYMQDHLGDTNNGSREWSLDTAPGTDQVKLVSVSLLNNRSIPAYSATVLEPLQVRIVYWVGVSNLKFRCGISLTTQGILAFGSLEPLETERNHIGFYTSTVLIPGNLLTEGKYSINISISSMQIIKQSYLSYTDALFVNIFDPLTGDSDRGDYTGRIAGVVRPRLTWTIDFLGDKLSKKPSQSGYT